MNNNIYIGIGFIIGFVFGMLLMLYKTKTTLVDYVTTDKVDTVEVEKVYSITDTVFSVLPTPVSRTIVDTVELPCRNQICSLEIEQTEYKDSTYDVWISGYQSCLDSIKIFSKTKYVEKTTTVTETKVVKDDKSKLYAGLGLQKTQGVYVPSINVYYGKKDFLIGATAGLIKSQPVYGVNINYKIK